MKKTVQFSSAKVQFYLDSSFAELGKIVDLSSVIFLTDENVFKKHRKKFGPQKTIVIPAGEQHKVQTTVDDIIQQLLQAGADRSLVLVGVGGGVVTDITGYVAGIFMRGISFGLIPTTILAMVDAAIGGKNGVDVGLYKNMVGLIRQPAFLLYDYSLLTTLPHDEWVNGFAEVIKHACIKDKKMFLELKHRKLNDYKKDPVLLSQLINRNASIKIKVVQQDEFEKGDRKLLNFGHTFGHAIETLYNIPHGYAVSIGMGIAAKLSYELCGFKHTNELIGLLKQFGLPPQFDFDKKETLKLVQNDKKKQGEVLQMVLLKNIGSGIIYPVHFQELSKRITD